MLQRNQRKAPINKLSCSKTLKTQQIEGFIVIYLEMVCLRPQNFAYSGSFAKGFHSCKVLFCIMIIALDESLMNKVHLQDV